MRGAVLLNGSKRSCLFHGAIGPAAGRETAAGAAGRLKAKSGCHSLTRPRSGRWHHCLGWRVTTSAFRKLKRSCEWTNASPELGETEQAYSTSRAAKYLDVYSLHAGAKKKRNFDLASLRFHQHLSGSAAPLCSDTSLAKHVESAPLPPCALS